MIALYEHIQELRAELRGCCMTRRERAAVQAELARAIAAQTHSIAPLTHLAGPKGGDHVQGHERQTGRQAPGGGSRLCRPAEQMGNPFVIGRDGSRDEMIAKYRTWVVQQPTLMAALHELRGKNLVCWCAPERCHAEVLIELANR